MLKKTLIGVVLATIAVSGDASAQGITQQTATIKRTPLLQENCGKLAAETSAESRQVKTESITGRITTSV